MAITWGLLGAKSESATATITPVPPTLTVGLTPDIMYAVHVSSNEDPKVAGFLANGFTEAPNSPQFVNATGASNAARIHLFGRRVATTGDTGPTFAICPGGALAYIYTLKGVDPAADIFHVAFGDHTNGATSAIAIPGGETTLDNCFVVGLVADHVASGVNRVDTTTSPPGYTAAGLTSIADRSFYRTTLGTGCGVAMCSGVKATKGAYGPINATAIPGSNLHQARISMAVAQGASSAVPNSIFCCTADCASEVPAPATPDHGHWNEAGGTPWASQTVIARNGRRAWEASPMADVSWRAKTVISTSTAGVIRLYLYIREMPDVDTEIVRFHVASGGNSPELRYRAATQDLVAWVGGAINGTPVPLIVGRWYRIDCAGDVSTGTRTMALTVDGVSKGSASLAVPANTLIKETIGCGIDLPCTGSLVFDDIRMGTKLAAYPFGAADGWSYQLTADGTHSYSAAGDFKYEDGSNVPLAVVDSYTRLLGLMSTAADTRIGRSGASVTEYLEWLLTGFPATTVVNSAEILSVHRGADANAHAQTLRLLSAASSLDLIPGYSFPGPGPYNHSVHLTLDPTGVALTTALLNAWKLRWPFSAIGLGEIGGVIVEVDCTLTTPPNTAPGSTERNPVHTFPGPGTYPVTHTVTDNNGLTGSKTVNVVVT